MNKLVFSFIFLITSNVIECFSQTIPTVEVLNQSVLYYNLKLSEDFYSIDEITNCSKAIDNMAIELKKVISLDMNPEQIIEKISNYLIAEQGIKYELSMDNSEFVLLPSVIKQKHANCIGLSCVYLAIAEKLNLPFYGALAPNHFFVIYENNNLLYNIETTNEGQSFSIDEYCVKHGVPSSFKNKYYFSKLTTRQVNGVLQGNIGLTFYKNKNYEKAVQFLKLSEQNLGQHPENMNNLGIVYLEMGQAKLAIDYFSKCITINPKNAKYFMNLAQSYYDIKDYKMSLNAYENAFKIDANMQQSVKNNILNIRYTIGNDCFNLGKYSEAISQWNEYLKLKPTDADVHNNLTIALYTTKKYQEAWKHLRLAEKYGNPVHPDVLNALKKAMPEPK
jgi:tetratricopeptide (TPR) repeat protein